MALPRNHAQHVNSGVKMASKGKSVFAAFATAKDVEKDGVWMEFVGFGNVSVRLRLARIGPTNHEFGKVAQELYRPYRRPGVEDVSLPPDVDYRLMCTLLARTVVRDWKNVFDDDGNAIPCTVENVERVLQGAPLLVEFIQQEARNVSHYSAARSEAEAKN